MEALSNHEFDGEFSSFVSQPDPNATWLPKIGFRYIGFIYSYESRNKVFHYSWMNSHPLSYAMSPVIKNKKTCKTWLPKTMIRFGKRLIGIAFPCYCETVQKFANNNRGYIENKVTKLHTKKIISELIATIMLRLPVLLLVLPILIGANKIFPHGSPHWRANKSGILGGLSGLSGQKLCIGLRSLPEQPNASTFPEGLWDWLLGYYDRTFNAAVNSTGVGYNETNISCIKRSFQWDELAEMNMAFNATMQEDGRTADMVLSWDHISWFLVRSINFQRGCMNGPTPVFVDPGYQRDPLFTFDVFVHYFSDLFAHFEVYGVDWQASTAGPYWQFYREGIGGDYNLSFSSKKRGLLSMILTTSISSGIPVSLPSSCSMLMKWGQGQGLGSPTQFFDEMTVYWASQEDLTVTIVETYLDSSEFLGGNRTHPLD
jgi:hypothetical protein